MKLKKEEYELLYRKLESRFKSSGNELVEKVKNQEDLTTEEVKKLLSKLEYSFKKSNNPTIANLEKIL